MDNEIPHTCEFECQDSVLKMRTRVPATWFSDQIEANLQQRSKQTSIPKGFRPGPAAQAEVRKRLIPTLKNELVTQIIEPPIADYALNNGLVVLVPGDIEVSSWDGPVDLNITVTVPVWAPIAIDLDKFIDALRGLHLSSSEQSDWHAAVIAALKATHTIDLSPNIVAKYAEITGTELGRSAAQDAEFAELLNATLLLDSLANTLKIQSSESDEKKRIAKLATQSGLSVIEISDRINQMGGLSVFKRELRRELAVEESKRIALSK